MIMSYSMMLEHSFQDKNTAKKIEIAVESVLEKGKRNKTKQQADEDCLI